MNTGPGDQSNNEMEVAHSVRQLIDHRASTTPDHIFLIDPHSRETITYSGLKQAASAISHQIASLGARPGDTIAYALGNGSLSALSILGIMYGGYLATAINLVAGSDAIAYALEHSQTRFVFADDRGAEAIGGALGRLDNPPKVIAPNPEFAPHHSAGELAAISSSTDGLLMYTSGTTGRPKGVVLTHGSLIAGGANTALAHALDEKDRAMCVLPLYHINGLCVTIMGPLASGGSLVLPPRFSVSSFWSTIAEWKCTWFSVVPTQISYLLHDQENQPEQSGSATTIRFGRSASAPLSPNVQNAFETRFGIPIVETMGLTETAAQILSNPLPPGIRKIGSPGIAYGNEIRIGDEQQRELPAHTEGEVLVRGPNVMRCYLRNEDATRAAITSDGWLRTGDLGKMDEDGYVYITGRLKELIIKGGENIAPREIDEALYSHPDVVEAAAFARKCERYGETVEAAVMLCEGSKATEAQLLELCSNQVGAFKSPERIHVLPELPKGPSGKIQRIKLVEQFG